MNIPISNLLFQKCKIVPFENLDGVIVAVNCSKEGTELKVRYFLNGEYKIEWFYDFDIELIEEFDKPKTPSQRMNDYIKLALGK